ncbi:MAG: amidohydrolase [Acidimicrobiaceae bacterium]|nr:amidohydrolase [Acidimicrobiaceae bacterium]|tara:strand:+ start:4307 stop:5509 length:1203 start_codon:yes stop_codon:yes gene_type:complete
MENGMSQEELADIKELVCDEVDARASMLLEASHAIHENPELNFEEHFAHELLTGILEDEGLSPVRKAYDLDTAFEANIEGAGPTVAVLCEYDALPDIGHACGHNIIATAGLGAGLAAATVARKMGGSLRILGTPAEEGGGGKVFMGDRGAFESVDAALMVHPASGDLVRMNTIAIHRLQVEYEGQAAHAAASPHRGKNALDAAVLGYQNVAALRQHIRPDERIHGIFTDGGRKPNIVPEYSSMEWYVRSKNMRTLEPLKKRVLSCLEAGAMASSCTMSHSWVDPYYADMVDNETICTLYAANAQRVGRDPIEPDSENKVVGSTDMGNVSYLVPSIHPMIGVAPYGVPIHTPDFAYHARSESGDSGVIDGAKILAMTIVDLWANNGSMETAQQEFTSSISQ